MDSDESIFSRKKAPNPSALYYRLGSGFKILCHPLRGNSLRGRRESTILHEDEAMGEEEPQHRPWGLGGSAAHDAPLLEEHSHKLRGVLHDRWLSRVRGAGAGVLRSTC